MTTEKTIRIIMVIIIIIALAQTGSAMQRTLLGRGRGLTRLFPLRLRSGAHQRRALAPKCAALVRAQLRSCTNGFELPIDLIARETLTNLVFKNLGRLHHSLPPELSRRRALQTSDGLCERCPGSDVVEARPITCPRLDAV